MVIPAKKKRGRPPGGGRGRDPLIALRMPLKERKVVEAWAAKQPGKLSLSKAIRTLIERGLAAEPPAPKRRTKGTPDAIREFIERGLAAPAPKRRTTKGGKSA